MLKFIEINSFYAYKILLLKKTYLQQLSNCSGSFKSWTIGKFSTEKE